MTHLARFYNFIERKTVTKKNIYIIPTKLGFLYIGVLFTIFLVGLTYTNNLTLIIAFWMLTVFIIQMLKTHRYVKEFKLLTDNLDDQYAFTDSSVHINNKKFHDYINLAIQLDSQFIDTNRFYKELCRGSYSVKRLKVTSFGNIKLFRSWKYIKLNKNFLIYPRKKIFDEFSIKNSTYLNSQIEEQFQEHRKYNQSISSKRIDWKVYAKNEQLYWKKYETEQSQKENIRIEDFTGDLETKLEKASYLIHQLYKQGTPWSLEYREYKLSSSSSSIHLNKCIAFMAKIND